MAGCAGWVQGYATPLILAAPLAVCFYFMPDEVIWGGIPTPDFTLTPQLPAIVGFGTALAFGWLLHRQIDLLQIWKRRWPLHLTLAIVATSLSYWLIGTTPTTTSAISPSIKMAYAACYPLAMWNWVFAVVGIALRFFSTASKTRRYIADSSYWLYLIHLPLVMALQVLTMQWNLHWSIKFPLIVTIAMVLLLLSYHYLVRFTYIGEVFEWAPAPPYQSYEVCPGSIRRSVSYFAGCQNRCAGFAKYSGCRVIRGA